MQNCIDIASSAVGPVTHSIQLRMDQHKSHFLKELPFVQLTAAHLCPVFTHPQWSGPQ